MKTPLITREGYEKLKQEKDTLWREERPEVTKKVTWAASLGDRSENASHSAREVMNQTVLLLACGLFHILDIIDVPLGFTCRSLYHRQIAHFFFQ